MDKHGAEDPPPLPSQLLSSGAQQSTLPAYREVLGDFLQKVPFQTYASNSGATTEPLAHDELENRHYWCEARQVEKSLKIHHVGDKVWRNNKYVHHVVYVVETYLPDNCLPENARLRLRKQEEKQKRRENEMQRKERLSTLHPRPSSRK
ncbi:predicted protein [Histoplasma mississippiense (nom. inval.)]|uniref:predicted protein n=1 Tax=Ajellomyces capsulatus (strain NAm1 / WU24) TaxID=2059318 RepID=UPI000157B8FB|nr:predicted protein [Histoplasma mississippiense (nom. inval.)]EDN03769.1 predicted protein [Histoplasma mississippiense (nom. inval.)]